MLNTLKNLHGFFIGWLGVSALTYGAGLIYAPLWWVVPGAFAILYSYITAKSFASNNKKG